jgi:hypothetical protein
MAPNDPFGHPGPDGPNVEQMRQARCPTCQQRAMRALVYAGRSALLGCPQQHVWWWPASPPQAVPRPRPPVPPVGPRRVRPR